VYVDAGLGDLRVFYYQVRARNTAGGEGEASVAVRAVTKSEPLPPVGLQVIERRLGANRLAWQPNVEQDLAEYRLLRTRSGKDVSELVSAVPAGQHEAEDDQVAADERVVYSLVAVDRNGLESATSQPAEVRSEGYRLVATALPDGVHLHWQGRTSEDFRSARILRGSGLRLSELGIVEGDSFVDSDVTPGRRYRYVVVLRRADASEAPPSAPVEIGVPKR